MMEENSNEIQNINWFPGHMAKTKRLIKENLNNVDIVAEIIDARVPCSSSNPLIHELIGDKPCIKILNKADLADEKETAKWCEYFKADGNFPLSANSKSHKISASFFSLCESVLREKLIRRQAKGTSGLTKRIMVVGIPNVGKSTFINSLSNKGSAKAEDRPGVTRTKQVIPLKNGYDLYDMPGILMPKIEKHESAVRLALTGAIKDEITDRLYLVRQLISILLKEHKGLLQDRYKITAENGNADEILDSIIRKRGFYIKGGEFDYDRAATVIIDEFRAGKIGRITLEKVSFND